MTTPPDPLESVHVLKSDFDLLQAAAHAAMDDYLNLCELLGLTPPPGYAPRQFMHEVVLPMVGHLAATQQQVDQASLAIRSRAEAMGNKTIEKNGAKGLLVGKRIPGLFEGSRAARRQAARDARRG